MAASGTLVIRFIGDLREFERATGSLGRKMSATGSALTKGLTLPIVGLGIAAGKSAADFQSSMSRIRGLVGQSEKQIRQYSKVILRDAPKWGKSPQELAEALFFVTSAGFKGRDALRVLAASAKASAAGLGETKNIADLVTSAVNAYGNKNLSAAKATDILTNAVRLGKLEAESLAPAMGRVLPVASAMGIGFDQVGAAMAAMSKTGTDAATGATQLRAILTSILKPTVQAEKQLKTMGLSAEGLRTQMREKGLLSVLTTLSQKFGDNQAAAAKVFPNVRALAGVLDMMGANADDTRAIFGKMANSTGVLRGAFKAASETAQFQFDQAMSTVKASLIELGIDLLPIASKALSKLTGFVSKASDAWSGLTPDMKRVIISAAGIAAAVGPVLLIFGKLLSMLAMFANPVGLVILAVTALAAILVKTGKGMAVLRAIAGAVLPPIKAFGAAFMRDVMPPLRDLWELIQRNVVPAIKAMMPVLATVAKFVLTVIGQAVIGAIKGAIQFIKGFVNVLAGVFKLVKALVTGQWSDAWDAVKQIVGGVIDAVIGAIKVWFNVGILGIFKQGIKLLLKGWRSLWDKVWSFAKGGLTSVWKFLDKTVGWIIRLFASLVKFLLGSVVKAFTAYRTIVTKVFGALRTVISVWWKIVSRVWGTIIRYIKSPLSNAFTAFQRVGSTVWNTLRSVISRVWDRVRGVFEKFRGWVGKDGVLANAFRAAIAAIRAIWEKLSDSAKRPVRFVVNTVYNNGLRKMIGLLPGVDTPARVNLGFAEGGWTGPGGKWAPKGVVHGDEFVLSKAARRALEGVAPGALDFMNRTGRWPLTALHEAIKRGAPGFFLGGRVPASGSANQHTSGYGWASWAGDINVPGSGDYGNPVRAWKSGVVAAVKYLTTSYGRHVVVNHPDTNEKTLYAHLSSIAVRAGQSVGAGQLLGRVGSTGNSSGPHLHFEVSGGQSLIGKIIGAIKEVIPDWAINAVSRAKSLLGDIRSMGGDGWAGIVKQAVTSVWGRVKDWASGKFGWLGKVAGSIFDRGGMLPPGGVALNLGRRPERILDPRTTENFEQLVRLLNRLGSMSGSLSVDTFGMPSNHARYTPRRPGDDPPGGGRPPVENHQHFPTSADPKAAARASADRLLEVLGE